MTWVFEEIGRFDDSCDISPPQVPLNALLMGVSSLSLSPQPLLPDDCAIVESLQSCGDQMLRIINDCLDIQKIESGKNWDEVVWSMVCSFAR